MVSVVLFHAVPRTLSSSPELVVWNTFVSSSLESSFTGVNGLFEIEFFTLKPPFFKILSRSSAIFQISCTVSSEWQMSSMCTSSFRTFTASGCNSSPSSAVFLKAICAMAGAGLSPNVKTVLT